MGLALGCLQLLLRAVLPAKYTDVFCVSYVTAQVKTLPSIPFHSPSSPTHRTTPHNTHTTQQRADAASAANAHAVATAAVTPTPNPLAAARKLSASKHLLVRNDSYMEMRQQQQTQMAEQMAAPATPLPASTLAVEGESDDATTAVVASAVGEKEEEEGPGAGLVPVAAF